MITRLLLAAQRVNTKFYLLRRAVAKYRWANTQTFITKDGIH
jgi:hypothetical protein